MRISISPCSSYLVLSVHTYLQPKTLCIAFPFKSRRERENKTSASSYSFLWLYYRTPSYPVTTLQSNSTTSCSPLSVAVEGEGSSAKGSLRNVLDDRENAPSNSTITSRPSSQSRKLARSRICTPLETTQLSSLTLRRRRSTGQLLLAHEP